MLVALHGLENVSYQFYTFPLIKCCHKSIPNSCSNAIIKIGKRNEMESKRRWRINQQILENNHKIFQGEVNCTLVGTCTHKKTAKGVDSSTATKLKFFPSAWSGSLRVICHYIPEKSFATRQNWFSLYKINVRQMQKTCWMPWTIQAVMDNVSNVRCTTTSIRWMAQVSLIVEWCALVYTRVGWTADIACLFTVSV
jgi:hypothetical protein